VTDPRMTTWARTLVDYSVEVRPGQTVAITGGVVAEPLLRAVYREVVARRAHPIMLPAFSGLAADLLDRGTDEQLEFITPVERFVREQADAIITFLAETNTKALSGVDPARQMFFQRARTELMQTFLRRSSAGELRWVGTLYPTDAYAQDAELATDDFAEFVFRACKLDQPDPVAAWQTQAREQQRLIDWLAGRREVRLRGPDTDLRLSVEGRTWINADGKMNFPDGEIFTGPVEDSVEGHVRFSYPVVVGGREVHDVRLRFEGGRVADASAAKNEAYLVQTLDTDAGARVLGEFAFGTNFGITRFTKNILFDEKIGGTVHMAIGSGYPETGNSNQSAVHWDLICDLREGGFVDVDGEPFLRDGRYLV
jgi:aminopeptidase